MQPVPSTAEIVAYRVLDKNYNHLLVQWALDMIEAGFDTEHLIELAGQNEPFHWSEIQVLVDKVFAELSLDSSNREQVIQNYVCFLVDQSLAGILKADRVLAIARDLYYAVNTPGYLTDFYLLYYAKDDLRYSEDQWYWDGANRSNIDTVITEYFMQWKSVNCMQ